MTDISVAESGEPNAAGANDGADALCRQIEEVRAAMRNAIEEARPKPEIVEIFIRATDVSDRAAGAEALYKKKKDLKRHAKFREVAQRSDLLRAQWLTSLEKAGRRFMGVPGKGVKIGTPPDPNLIVLTDLFPHLISRAGEGGKPRFAASR
jgi:hypothetical protein